MPRGPGPPFGRPCAAGHPLMAVLSSAPTDGPIPGQLRGRLQARGRRPARFRARARREEEEMEGGHAQEGGRKGEEDENGQGSKLTPPARRGPATGAGAPRRAG
ncbi:unnamed protein product, partial [Prorocentrum cordatum]